MKVESFLLLIPALISASPIRSVGVEEFPGNTPPERSQNGRHNSLAGDHVLAFDILNHEQGGEREVVARRADELKDSEEAGLMGENKINLLQGAAGLITIGLNSALREDGREGGLGAVLSCTEPIAGGGKREDEEEGRVEKRDNQQDHSSPNKRHTNYDAKPFKNENGTEPSLEDPGNDDTPSTGEDEDYKDDDEDSGTLTVLSLPKPQSPQT